MTFSAINKELECDYIYIFHNRRITYDAVHTLIYSNRNQTVTVVPELGAE
jgi:hypothetical protein